MELRKCCNHPYLFDGAEPEFDGQFILGEHFHADGYVNFNTKQSRLQVNIS